MGWGDRFKEKMRQETHLSKDLHHFKGTDNDRVRSMLKEADEVASRLKVFKKHIHETSSAITSLINSTHKTLVAPPPQIFDRDPATNKAVPTPIDKHIHAIRVDDLTNICQRYENDLRTDVYGPIDRWLDVHKEISSKMSQLENRRLEFDNARRLHGRVELERVRSLQKHDRVEPAVAAKLDQQNADADAKRLAFTQYESEVHAQLSGLIYDTQNLQSIFAQAFKIQGAALTAVANPAAPPLTHQQMSGAPHAMHAIEHHAHSNPFVGGAGQAAGSGNYAQQGPLSQHPPMMVPQ